MDRFLKKTTDKAKSGRNVTPYQRHSEFKEWTHVSGGKLFCTACNIVLNHERKSVLDQHKASSRHLSCMKRIDDQGEPAVKRQRTITDCENVVTKTCPNTVSAEEAIEMIQFATESQMPMLPSKNQQKRWILVNIFHNLQGLPETEKAHKLMVEANGFLTMQDTMLAHKLYVQKLLDSDLDDEEFLQKLEKLHQQFWVFPNMDAVLIRFIEKQQKTNLKRVVDLGVSVVGGNIFYHKLACNLVHCGMQSKASILFESLKNKINKRLILSHCNYYIQNEQVESLESLVEVTKSLPLNRGVMLSQLIEAYVKVKDLTKALDVLQTMKDENAVPIKSTLDALSSALKHSIMEEPPLLTSFLVEVSKQKKNVAMATNIEDEGSSVDFPTISSSSLSSSASSSSSSLDGERILSTALESEKSSDLTSKSLERKDIKSE